jgi:dienelactone hydrolase
MRIMNDVRAYAQALPPRTASSAPSASAGAAAPSSPTRSRSRRSTPPCRTTADAADATAYANAKVPVLGLYGGNDNRVNANIELAKTEMAKAKASYDPHIFEGAGHGFLRQQAGNAERDRQPEGHRTGLAAHDRVPEEAHQIRRRRHFAWLKPRGVPKEH